MNFIAIKSKLFNFSLLHGLPSNPRHNTYIYFIGRNLDTRTTMLKGHASQWICNSRITTVFHEFSRFTLYLLVNSRITRNPFQTGPATSNLKTQENQSSNQSAYLLANSGLEGIANSLKVLFFLFKRRLESLNCSFIVYCKRSLPTPFCEFWHVPLPWNAHICPCDSDLHDNRTSFCLLIRRRTITTVRRVRGQASKSADAHESSLGFLCFIN